MKHKPKSDDRSGMLTKGDIERLWPIPIIDDRQNEKEESDDRKKRRKKR